VTLKRLEDAKKSFLALEALSFVSLGGIPTRGRGARHVGIFIGSKLAFRLSEIGLGMRLGPHVKGDEICGLVWVCHTHKED